MSKKKGKIRIRVGKFYNVRDGSEKGHPGFAFNVDYVNGEYDFLITITTYQKGSIPINPTDARVKKSYIKANPFRGTRNDFGNKQYVDMHFDIIALAIGETIKKKKYVFGSHYKKKHRLK